MIFAAGFGTRMGTLTQERPKPLIEVAGRALIDHALEQVEAYGAERVVVNLHYKPDQLRQHLDGRKVTLAEEQPDILETGGGLRAALPHLGAGPVFTMNSDAVWAGPNPLEVLAGAWRPAEMDALLLCIPPERATGHTGAGDFTLAADGRASRGPGVIYSGVQIIRTDGIAGIAEKAFSLNLLWDEMLARERLFATVYPGHWCDVGRPEGIRLAENMLGSRNV